MGLLSAIMFQKKLYVKFGLGLMVSIIQFVAELFITTILSEIYDFTVLPLPMGLYVRGVIYARLTALVITVGVGRVLSKRLSLSIKASPEKFVWLFILTIAGFFVLDILFDILMDSQNDKVVMQLLIAIGIICTIWLYLLFNEFEMQEQKLIKQKYLYMEELQKIQEEAWKEITEKNKNMRILIHDVKNFMLMIRGYLEHGEIAIAEEKLDDYLNELIENQTINSGIFIFDTVLSAKEQLAKEKGIKFKCSLILNEEELYVDPVDVARIFSNAIDNAIEAASQIEDHSKRRVNLEIYTIDEYLHIIVENTVAQPVIVKNNSVETTKKEKDLHGLGISSMKALADKYSGKVILQCPENIFSTTIILENKKKEA